jgi:chromosome partitioning protein
VRTHFNELVFKTVIPRNIKLSECTSFGKPIILYDVNSKGCTAYLDLAREVLTKSHNHQKPLLNTQNMPELGA